jgi:hypothetical protein
MAVLGPVLVLGWPRARLARAVGFVLILPGILLGVVGVVGLAVR